MEGSTLPPPLLSLLLHLERNTASTSPTSYFLSTSAVELAASYAVTSSALESNNAKHPSYVTEVETELVHKVVEDRESINEANLKAVSSSQMPVNNLDFKTDSVIETGFL